MKDSNLQINAPLMTVDEYLEFEERSETRHEFVNNQLIPMPGTTIFHNIICINLTFFLRSLLKKGLYRIVQENVKIQVSSDRDYTYPDVAITSDQRDLDAQNNYFIRFPKVIFEVISKTSRTEDSVDKFIRYKNIEPLQNYILVDSEKELIEVRIKLKNGDWESETYLPSNIRFPVPALDIELTFDEVYEGISFVQ